MINIECHLSDNTCNMMFLSYVDDYHQTGLQNMYIVRKNSRSGPTLPKTSLLSMVTSHPGNRLYPSSLPHLTLNISIHTFLMSLFIAAFICCLL